MAQFSVDFIYSEHIPWGLLEQHVAHDTKPSVYSPRGTAHAGAC